MTGSCLINLSLSVTFLFFSFSNCWGQEKLPLRFLPADTNLVTVINVKSILNSEISQQTGWQKELENRFQNGITAIPPEIETYIVGSKVKPFVPQTLWSIGLMKLPPQLAFADLAQHEQVAVEELSGMKAYFTKRGEYVVALPENHLAKFSPGDRQEVAQYIRTTLPQQQPAVSSYLQSVSNSTPHIIIALDMQDMINPTIARRYLEEDDRFKSHRTLIDKLVKLLSGMRGIKVQQTIGKSIETEVLLEFSDDVGTAAFGLRAILLGLLDDMGAYIQELDQAEVKTQGSTVILKTKLSDESFRFLLSFVIPSRIATGDNHFQPRFKPEISKPDRTLSPEQATKKYVDSIHGMLDDLQKSINRANANSRIYSWYDNFASRIRSLDKTNVSEAALKYGENVAYELQLLSTSLRGSIIEVNNLNGAVVYNYQFHPGYINYNPWGWNFGYQQDHYSVTSNLQQIREKQADAVSKGAKEREEIWNNLLANRARMERLLLSSPDKK